MVQRYRGINLSDLGSQNMKENETNSIRLISYHHKVKEKLCKIRKCKKKKKSPKIRQQREFECFVRDQ